MRDSLLISLLLSAFLATHAHDLINTVLSGEQSVSQAPHGVGFRRLHGSPYPPATADKDSGPRHKQAYVSLIYDDSFLLGLRVLGLSLQDTGTERDRVAIVAGNLSSASLATLAMDGWRLKHVDPLANPGKWTQSNNGGKSFPARFWGVYTKLLVWNMTEYDTVVYLDADTIAMRNIDELFLCDGLCGVLRHSERLNSGVMVLQPNADLIRDMLLQAPNAPSYTGGDQGFLNHYFARFPGAPLFDPKASDTLLSKRHPEGCGGSVKSSSTSSTSGAVQDKLCMGRLPTVYNADIGLYVANSNRWTVPEDRLGVLHYTLGTFKPWDWWSSWILGENGATWQKLRQRLPPAADGATGGWDARQRMTTFICLPAPWIIAFLAVRRWCWKQGLGACLRCLVCGARGKASSSVRLPVIRSASEGAPHKHAVGLPLGFSAAAIGAGGLSTLISLFLAVKLIVPRQIVSTMGWALAYEWTALLLLALFSQYLSFCRHWGANASAASGGRGSSYGSPFNGVFWCGNRPWLETAVGSAVLLFALGLAPWWGDVLGVMTLSTKVVMTCVAAVVSLIVVSQCFIGMAVVWYTCGLLEGGTPPLGLLASKE